jgi:hypothetical protein
MALIFNFFSGPSKIKNSFSSCGDENNFTLAQPDSFFQTFPKIKLYLEKIKSPSFKKLSLSEIIRLL